MHDWSVIWQPVVLQAVGGKVGGQLFSLLLDCTLGNEAGVCLDTPYLVRQGQASDDLEGWDSQLRS